MAALAPNGAHTRMLTSASVSQHSNTFGGSAADCRTLSIQGAAAVVKRSDSKVTPELWNPDFDRKLRNGIGKSLTEQNIVIDEILGADPGLTRAAVVTRFVQKLLHYASNSNLEMRESAIQHILQLQPALDRVAVGAQLDQIARAGLPAWVNSNFWTREIDPLVSVRRRPS